MQQYGLFELFNRDHRGWLVSRFWRQEPVLRCDIDRALKNDPDALSEPIVAAIIDAQQQGTLARKRGRNPCSFGQMANIMLAQQSVQRIAKWIRRKRSRRLSGEKKKRGELSPTAEAAELVARKYKMDSGTSLLNRISFQRKHCPYFCD